MAARRSEEDPAPEENAECSNSVPAAVNAARVPARGDSSRAYLRRIPLECLPPPASTGSRDAIAVDCVSLVMSSLPRAVDLRLRVLEVLASIAGAEFVSAIPSGDHELRLLLSPQDAAALLGTVSTLTAVVVPLADDNGAPWLFVGHDTRSNAVLIREAECLRLRPVTVVVSSKL